MAVDLELGFCEQCLRRDKCTCAGDTSKNASLASPSVPDVPGDRVGDTSPALEMRPQASPMSPNTHRGHGIGTSDHKGKHKLYAVNFSDISARDVEMLNDDLPLEEVVVFVGEEGIGKGLWWANLAANLTTGHEPINIGVIVAEDDPERTLKPRLELAGAEISRIQLLTLDPDLLVGTPSLPAHVDLIGKAIDDFDLKLVVVDPWLSTVSGHLQIKDTQQARQALDPLLRLSRQKKATILLVTHTNRAGGSTRDIYGGTAALRQTARVTLLALEDPHDDTLLWVGVEKSNIVRRGPAVAYRKQKGSNGAWQAVTEATGNELTIRELHETFTERTDNRTGDKWHEVERIARTNHGVITRSAIEEVFQRDIDPTSSDHSAQIARARGAAKKAIQRWTKGTNTRLDVLERDTYCLPVTPNTTPQGDTGDARDAFPMRETRPLDVPLDIPLPIPTPERNPQ